MCESMTDKRTALQLAMEYTLQGCCSIIRTVLANQAQGLAYYVVKDMGSSKLGAGKLLAYGPTCTCKDLDAARTFKLDTELASTMKLFDYYVHCGDTAAERKAFCTELLMHAVRAVALSPSVMLHDSMEHCAACVRENSILEVASLTTEVEFWLKELKELRHPKSEVVALRTMYELAAQTWARIQEEVC